MKFIIAIVLATGVAIFFALAALDDPGYIVLARAPYQIRMPLMLFILLLAVGFVALYMLIGFILSLLRAPKTMRKWHQQHNEKSAQHESVQGYADLILGNWASAERRLQHKLEYNQASLLNYLAAAYAAQQQGQLPRRDRYLTTALQRHPKQAKAIYLTRARLQYQSGQLAESRNTLERLRLVLPKNVPAIRLLADVYQDLGDWPSLVKLLHTVKNLSAFPPTEMQAREKLAYHHHLTNAPPVSADGGQVSAAWQALPAAKKRDATVIACYARQLIRSDAMVLAEKLLRGALNREWHRELAYLYGKVETEFVNEQIKVTENWVKKYSPQPDLMLSLARLYGRAGQHDKAQQLLKQTIAAGGREEALLELGASLEQGGEKDAALLCYKQGIAALSTDDDTPQPQPVSGELVPVSYQGEAMPGVGER